MKSVFVDKNNLPDVNDLSSALENTYPLWQSIRDYVFAKYPQATEEWNYSSDKYGWSFRIKDSKRVIIYLLPRAAFFKVAFVFGQKATDAILQSGVSSVIKAELEAARVYAEGRGIRIDIKDSKIIDDIKLLMDIKLTH